MIKYKHKKVKTENKFKLKKTGLISLDSVTLNRFLKKPLSWKISLVRTNSKKYAPIK